MNTGDIIKKLRKERKLTQEQLGEMIGVQKSAIAKYESGRVENLKRSTIEQLAKIFDVTPSYILGLHEERITPISNIIFDDYFPLHYSTNLSAGSLQELLDTEPDAIVYVPIKYQMIKKRLNAFKVNGTSMNNVIQDGSVVITENIDHLSSIKDGTIVVAWVDGSATVKRLYSNATSVTLMPDSTDKSHMPIVLSLDECQIKIIGRVIWHMNPDDMDEKHY